MYGLEVSSKFVALYQLIYPALMQETKITKLQINEETFEYHLDKMKHIEKFITKVKSNISRSQFKEDIHIFHCQKSKTKNSKP
jgi:hypothetical protein